ncbi:MAG: terminase small subunit [Terriglobales bacterium]
MANGKFNGRRQLFVKHYRLTRNARTAAIAAGYSKKTAQAAGSRLLRDSAVRTAITSQDRALHKKLDLTAERVLEEIARIAFADIRRIFNRDGTARSITELDPDTAAALAGVEIEELFAVQDSKRKKIGYTKKFKLANKVDALALAGRYFRLFTDKVLHVNVNPDIKHVSDAALEKILENLNKS